MMIPIIIMGGILTGWFTPTEAGMIASVYILVVVVPLLNPQPHPPFAARLRLYRPALCHSAGAGRGGLRLRLDARLSARARHRRRAGSRLYAGTDGRMIMFLMVLLFIVIGDFMDAVPAIIIFMPIIIKLNELGDIKPLHMGVVIITTLVFGLITPPYGLILVGGVEIRRRAVPQARCMRRCRSILCFSSPSASRCCSRRSCCSSAEASAPGIGRLLQGPDRPLYLPAIGAILRAARSIRCGCRKDRARAAGRSRRSGSSSVTR